MRYRDTVTNVNPVGDLGFEAIAATWAVQDDGIALTAAGADLSRFNNGGALLWNHDPDALIGQVPKARTTARGLAISGRFPPSGVSPRADEARGLLKAGIVNSLSIGFDVTEYVPIDAQRPRDGIRATKWILYEVSLTSIPMDTGAVVTARSRRDRYGAPLLGDGGDFAARKAEARRLERVHRLTQGDVMAWSPAHFMSEVRANEWRQMLERYYGVR